MQITKAKTITQDERIAAIENTVVAPVQKSLVVAAGDGPITPSSDLVVITKGSACAITLPAPTAGAQSAGGDDGKELSVLATTAFAHTVTTPSNKINGNKAVATFAAAVGNLVEFYAYNGLWYMRPSTGITLS